MGIDSSASVPPNYPLFGGLAAADWTVTYHAALAGLIEDWDGVEIHYTALLSTSFLDARDRFALEGRVFNTVGELIAVDGEDLWDGALPNPVGYDEYGRAISGDTAVWTGTNGLGTWSGDAAGDWLSPSSFELATIGDAHDPTTTNWLDAATRTADRTARLYGISAALTVPEQVSVVPEPASLVLLSTGLVSMAGLGWRRSRRRG